MNKDARKSLLIARAAALGLVSSVAGLMNASHAEVREEAANVKRHEVSDSIIDEEVDGVESQLALDTTAERFGQEDLALSPKERTKLREEVANAQLARHYRHALVVLRPNDENELNAYAELSNAGDVS